jgi:cell division protease FtsH
MGSADEPIFIGKEIAQHADYSDDTANRIDTEVRALLKEALDTARRILSEEREKLESLTEALMEKETLDDAEIRALWNILPSKTEETDPS